jgi:hypothetical protein
MKKIVLYIAVILLAVACNNSSTDDKINRSAFSTFAETEVADNNTRLLKPNNKAQKKIERKLIKTGNLTFETSDLNKTKVTIESLVKANNGYIANDSEYKTYDRISNTISLRIPSDKFDNFIVEISKGVEKFDNKNINISDVTEQFLDVEARLKTKKALEVKYLEILKKAKTVREILDVERELGKLRGDIEATEGRLNYLKNQVTFSTLSITFYKKVAESESSFGGKIKDAFEDGFDNIKAFFLFLINIWPFIIILFLVFFYIRKRRKSRTKS